MDFDTSTEAGQVASLTQKALAGQATIIKSLEGKQFLVVPEGFTMQDVTPTNGTTTLPPDVTRQAVALQSLDSLGEYGTKFKTETTTLFADVDSNTIVAAIDYHGPTQPQLVAHVATLKLPYSVEWETWNGIDGAMMSQLDFARFIEENAADIVAPSGADLLEICQDLQAVQHANFKTRVKTHIDNVSFEYSDVTDVGTEAGNVAPPKRFALQLPVFFGDSPVSMFANLRYRVAEGKLLLGISLFRKEHVRQAVFRQHVLTAQDRIDCLAVFGRFATSR